MSETAENLEILISKLNDKGKNTILGKFAGIKNFTDWNPKENGADLLKVVAAIVSKNTHEFCIGKNRSMLMLIDKDGNHMRTTTQSTNGDTIELIYEACFDHIIRTIETSEMLQDAISHNDNSGEKKLYSVKSFDLTFTKKEGLDFINKRFYDNTGHLCDVDRDGNVQFMIMADPNAVNLHELPNPPFKHEAENKRPFDLQFTNQQIIHRVMNEYGGINRSTGECSIPVNIKVSDKTFSGTISAVITKAWTGTDNNLNVHIVPTKNKVAASTSGGQLILDFGDKKD